MLAWVRSTAQLAPQRPQSPTGQPRPTPLAKVAGTLVAQTEAGWAARLKEENPRSWTEESLQEELAKRKREGNCLVMVNLLFAKPISPKPRGGG